MIRFETAEKEVEVARRRLDRLLADGERIKAEIVAARKRLKQAEIAAAKATPKKPKE